MINNSFNKNEILRVSNVSFAYGDYQVFSDISFSVRAGEVFCLMGPNGCGKTTIIDSVLGIHQPQKGEIILCNKPLKHYKRHEIAQQISYVPQLHSTSFPYTVFQVVLMGRTSYTGLFGEPNEEDEHITMDALQKVGMQDFADRPYSLLSGGEIKLVLLARALGQKTPLIILDEPTAHLDFKNELIFLETIAEICVEDKIAVLMATHMPSHAFYFESKGMPVCTAMMEKGKKGFCACDKASSVINEEMLAEVYKVRSQIVAATDGEQNTKAVALFGTIK